MCLLQALEQVEAWTGLWASEICWSSKTFLKNFLPPQIFDAFLRSDCSNFAIFYLLLIELSICNEFDLSLVYLTNNVTIKNGTTDPPSMITTTRIPAERMSEWPKFHIICQNNFYGLPTGNCSVQAGLKVGARISYGFHQRVRCSIAFNRTCECNLIIRIYQIKTFFLSYGQVERTWKAEKNDQPKSRPSTGRFSLNN